MGLVKKNINEIDLADLEGSLKQYTDTAVNSIPQPDLSDYLTRSHAYNMPQVQPIPGQDQNPFKIGSLLVTKSYVDMTVNNSQPNLSNYLTTNNIYIPPSDLIVVEVPNPDDNKLITKKYLDSAMPDSFLTILYTTHSILVELLMIDSN